MSPQYIYFFITICIVGCPSSGASPFSLRTNIAAPPPSLIRPVQHISAYCSLVKHILPRPDQLSRPMSASQSSAEVVTALRKVMNTQTSIPSAFSKSAQVKAPRLIVFQRTSLQLSIGLPNEFYSNQAHHNMFHGIMLFNQID